MSAFDFLDVPGMEPLNVRNKLNEYFRELFERRRKYSNEIQEKRERLEERRKRAELAAFLEKYPLFQENFQKETSR